MKFSVHIKKGIDLFFITTSCNIILVTDISGKRIISVRSFFVNVSRRLHGCRCKCIIYYLIAKRINFPVCGSGYLDK